MGSVAYTVNFLRDKKNIHHILYAYNTDRVTTLEQYMRGYQGDDVIDLFRWICMTGVKNSEVSSIMH